MKQIEKFSDESDRATALEEAAIEIAVQQIRSKAKQLEIKPTGFCFNCEAKIDSDKRFCDKDCLDDYTKRVGRKN